MLFCEPTKLYGAAPIQRHKMNHFVSNARERMFIADVQNVILHESVQHITFPQPHKFVFIVLCLNAFLNVVALCTEKKYAFPSHINYLKSTAQQP